MLSMSKFFIIFIFLFVIISPSVSVKTILAIGRTGLGKSFTATLFGFDAELSDGEDSMTKIVKVHRRKGYEYVYIDTPGFDDSDTNVTDDQTIQKILSEMKKENIVSVNTVMWFVNSADRATGSLQKEAKFIEDLAKYNHGKNVWDNVLVIYKGLKDTLNKNMITGAIKKNGMFNPTNIQILPVFLFEKLPEDSLNRITSSDEILRKKGIYKTEMLRDVYKDIIKKYHKDPFQVVFKDAKCIKCGLKTDPRLAKGFPCHVEAKRTHDHIERYDVVTGYTHPGYLTTEQDSGWELADDIVNAIPLVNVINNAFGITKIGKSHTQRQVWSCCNNSKGSSGCKTVKESRWRYSCCHIDVENKESESGCKKICKYCERGWGNSTGCMYMEHKFDMGYHD